MRRYLFVSLLIGIIVSITVLTLLHLGLFGAAGAAVADLYASMGFAVEKPARFVETGLVIAVAFAAAWCVIDIPQVGQKVMVFVGLMLVLLALSPTLALYGVGFEPFSSVSAAFLAAAAGFFYAGTEHGMRKRLLIDVLGTRVSRKTFNRLMNSREPVRFSGSTRNVTVLTCRVFNHAELKEKMEPSELISMGNLFLRNTADFLLDRGGYLDESAPDMVRVYFGLVQESEDHTIDACRAALELRTRLRNLNEECKTRWFQKLDLGIGLGSGPMTVGIYGSQRHSYFSGVGGESDFARRLAQGNERYGSEILLSSRTHQLVKDGVEVRPMEMLYDPGRNLMMEVYELMALKGDFSEEEAARRDAFWESVVRYRAGNFEEALAGFNEAQPPEGEDRVVRFFVEKCRAGLAGERKARPEGSHEMTDDGHARLINLM